MKMTPFLTKNHKEDRVKWARKYLDLDAENWNNVVFSDEKKSNLDGPDGMAYYWADKIVESRHFQSAKMTVVV